MNTRCQYLQPVAKTEAKAGVEAGTLASDMSLSVNGLRVSAAQASQYVGPRLKEAGSAPE